MYRWTNTLMSQGRLHSWPCWWTLRSQNRIWWYISTPHLPPLLSRQGPRLSFWCWDECRDPLRAGAENVEALKSVFWIWNFQCNAFVAVLYTSRLHWHKRVSLKSLEHPQNRNWKQGVLSQTFDLLKYKLFHFFARNTKLLSILLYGSSWDSKVLNYIKQLSTVAVEFRSWTLLLLPHQWAPSAGIILQWHKSDQ